MYQICFYVPKTHLEQVKQAMFTSGAGNIGNYSCCSWQTLGIGQFMPLEESNAFIGHKNQITKVIEYQVIMICPDEKINEVVSVLKSAHPYEEVSYQVLKLVDI